MIYDISCIIHISLQCGEARGETRDKAEFLVCQGGQWNSLPDLVKSAKTVNLFKNGLDNLIEREKQRRVTAYIGGS